MYQSVCCSETQLYSICKQHTAIFPVSKSCKKGRCLNHNKVIKYLIAVKWYLSNQQFKCAAATHLRL